MGTTEEALKYLELGYYLGLTGYLCKVNSMPLLSVKHSINSQNSSGQV
jgi:hypothetical protein